MARLKLPWWPDATAGDLVRGVGEAWESRRDQFRPEPVITILPSRDEATAVPADPVDVEIVPEIEVLNTHIADLLRVVQLSQELNMGFNTELPDYEIIDDSFSNENRSVQCAYATLANATGRTAALDAVVSKFGALRGVMSALASFDSLVEEHGLGARSATPISGRTLVDIAQGEAVLLMTLDPDSATSVSDNSQTVLVVGVRQLGGQDLEFLVANSYAPFDIEGTTEVVTSNLTWANAADITRQCISNDPNAETVRVYKLNMVN